MGMPTTLREMLISLFCRYCEVEFSEDDETKPVAYLAIKAIEKRAQMIWEQLYESDIFLTQAVRLTTHIE